MRRVRRAVTLLGLMTEPKSTKPYPEVAAQANFPASLVLTAQSLHLEGNGALAASRGLTFTIL